MGCATIVIYECLDGVVPRLALAEPSGVWQIVPWRVWAASKSDIATSLYGTSLAAGAFTLALLALAACYAGALALVRGTSGRATTLAVFILGAVFQLQQLDAPVLLSSDPFSYLIYGRIVAMYGGDPYVQPPSAFPEDPVLPLVYWKHVPSFYGPVWTEVSTIVALATGDNTALAVFLFRLIAAAAALGTAVLIWLTLRGQGSAAAIFGAAVWLWNPLVPIESGMSGHNDLLMVLLLVIGWYLAKRVGGALFPGLSAVFAAAMVKIIAAIAAPVLALLWLRAHASGRAMVRGVASTGIAALLGMIVLLSLGRSPAEGLDVGALGSDTDRYTNSVHELILAGARLLMADSVDDIRTPLGFKPWLSETLEPVGLWSVSGKSSRLIASIEPGEPMLVVAPPERGLVRVFVSRLDRTGYVPATQIAARREVEPAQAAVAEARIGEWTSHSGLPLANALIRRVTYGLFLLGMVVVLLRTWWSDDGAQRMLELFMLSLVTLASWIWPWYLLWPLAFAALSGPSRLVRLAVTLSISSLLIYPLFGYQGSELWWLFNGRAIIVWVVPIVAFVACEHVIAGWPRGGAPAGQG